MLLKDQAKMTGEVKVDCSGPLGVSICSCLSGIVQELDIVVLTVKQALATKSVPTLETMVKVGGGSCVRPA